MVYIKNDLTLSKIVVFNLSNFFNLSHKIKKTLLQNLTTGQRK